MFKKHRTGVSTNWDTLTTKQKRHRIFAVISVSSLRFWYVCGKAKQHYYETIPMDDSNIDGIRDDLYKDYTTALDTKNVLDKDQKLATIKRMLYGSN